MQTNSTFLLTISPEEIVILLLDFSISIDPTLKLSYATIQALGPNVIFLRLSFFCSFLVKSSTKLVLDFIILIYSARLYLFLELSFNVSALSDEHNESFKLILESFYSNSEN
jgi:hypothetical protein